MPSTDPRTVEAPVDPCLPHAETTALREIVNVVDTGSLGLTRARTKKRPYADGEAKFEVTRGPFKFFFDVISIVHTITIP